MASPVSGVRDATVEPFTPRTNAKMTEQFTEQISRIVALLASGQELRQQFYELGSLREKPNQDTAVIDQQRKSVSQQIDQNYTTLNDFVENLEKFNEENFQRLNLGSRAKIIAYKDRSDLQYLFFIHPSRFFKSLLQKPIMCDEPFTPRTSASIKEQFAVIEPFTPRTSASIKEQFAVKIAAVKNLYGSHEKLCLEFHQLAGSRENPDQDTVAIDQQLEEVDKQISEQYITLTELAEELEEFNKENFHRLGSADKEEIIKCKREAGLDPDDTSS